MPFRTERASPQFELARRLRPCSEERCTWGGPKISLKGGTNTHSLILTKTCCKIILARLRMTFLPLILLNVDVDALKHNKPALQ